MRWLLLIVLWGLVIPDTRAEVVYRRRRTPPATVYNRLFRWLPYLWVDPPEPGGRKKKKGDGTDGADGDGANANGSGAGLGDGSGSSGSSGGGSGSGGGLLGAARGGATGGAGNGSEKQANGFSYDKDAKKNLDPREVERPGGNPPPPGGDGPPPGPPNKPQPFAQWWPMCVFVAPGYPNANAAIKKMVEMSAQCQVNLEVYAVPLTPASYSGIKDNPQALNSLQTSSCNMKEGINVPKGSTQILGTSDIAADIMCDSWEAIPGGGRKPTTKVAGCAELAKSGGASADIMRKKYNHRTGESEHLNLATGDIAASIVDNNQGGDVASHEGIGHSEMGWPNGKLAGNGIGNPNDINETGAEGGPMGIYTPTGCTQMRMQALPNDGTHIYDPTLTMYYDPQMSPFNLGEKLFPPNKPPPPNHDPPTPPGSPPPQGDPPRVAEQPPPSTSGPDTSSQLFNSVGSPSSSSTPDQKHKLAGGGGSPFPQAGGDPVVSLRNGGGRSADAPPDVAQVPDRPVVGADGKPVPQSQGSGGSAFSYNKGASKTVGDDVTSGSGGGGGVSGAAASGQSPGASGFSYNNGAGKNLGDGSSVDGSASGGDGFDGGGGRGPASTGAARSRDGMLGASLFKDVTAGSSVLDDDFFTKLQFEEDPKEKKKKRKPIGQALRQPGNTVREVEVKYNNATAGTTEPAPTPEE